MIKDR